MSAKVHPDSLTRALTRKGWRIVPGVSTRTGRVRWVIVYNGARMWTKTRLDNAIAYVKAHR